MQLEILEETKDWLVVYKPHGIIVEENPYETSVESILKETYKFVGIVHRLDRVTSGVLLIAKKKSILRELNKQFSDKTVKKEYLALVKNEPPKQKDILTNFLFKDQKNKIAVIFETKQFKCFEVSLEYEIIEKQEENYLLKIKPFTGKFHQIRVQLAHINCAIVNDTKYNNEEQLEHLKSIALQAFSLSFEDPITKNNIFVEVKEKFRYKN